MNATYFRQADAVIFIYDVGRHETTKSVLHWANELDEKAGRGPLQERMVTCLVGNKIDLPEDMQ